MSVAPARPARPRDTTTTAVLCMVAAASGYALTPTLAKVAYDHGANPYGLLAVRFPVAAALLGAVLAWRRRPRTVALRGWLLPATVLVYCGQTLTFFEALTRMDAGPTSLVLYLYPALVTAAGVLALGEPLSARAAIALPLTLAGVALSIGFDGRPNVAGVALAATSALCYATYFLLVKAQLSRRADPVELTALVYAGAGVVYLVLAAATGAARTPGGAAAWGALAVIVLASTVAASLLTFTALRRLPAPTAAMVATIEPVMTVAIAALALGERPAPLQLAGGALIIAALVLLARSVQPTEIVRNSTCWSSE
jgi:drug/metabolite transporter (DMT)-like permease